MARGQRPNRYDDTSPNGVAYFDPAFEFGDQDQQFERIPSRRRRKKSAPRMPSPKKGQGKTGRRKRKSR